ncbi:MAG: hypothetical protein DMD38_01420 [Gemmatimonadetes bacterium]|nr:MAG: hypothetical protein AUI86_01250 [Gemmatimonadetes bacterium 13_1_40CM_3_66_12]OLD89399.1 MAG: hypothetical protein AUG85_02000 [Gemmatimonadetes bacterium 13_1_20CM_4_66_11]PYP98079.1 MAG: hypothetical protein DMD38_01420 [Gemmatimonadota bacterium]
MTGWQDSWTFRIVDQDTGAAVPGVPVSVLESGGRSGGYWVSDSDGLVRIPKHDQPRLRLRVGLRNEEAIEFDARSLPDDTIPLTAPRDISVAGTAAPSAPAAAAPSPSPATTPGHLMRFARIGVLPKDRDTTSQSSHDPTSVRYGVLIEIELVWQSLGAEAGATLYSISLGPGEEVKLAISDGRWRKSPDARERPLQIVAKMVGARQIGDGLDAMPLDVCIAADLPSAAADTVKLLAERTARTCEALRRRALGVTELDGEKAAGATLRTLRNMRSEGVLTYHFVEPVERHRVIVRTPRFRPALLVPFQLPNIATREVVRRFGHALRRNLLDRTLGADVDLVRGPDAVSAAVEQRVYAHISAHLAYYSATIIAAGDPAERFFALAKLRDARGYPLTDLIENSVVDRVGNYVAFPLRSVAHTSPEWRSALTSGSAQPARASQEFIVTLPVPGVWLRSELFPAHVATESDAGAEEAKPEGRTERRKRG